MRPLLAEVESRWPEEDLDVLRAEGAQHRLAFDEAAPKKQARRLAVAQGFGCAATAPAGRWPRSG